MDVGWDNEPVYSVPLDLPREDEDNESVSTDLVANQDRSQASSKFRQFIRTFTDQATGEFIYRQQLSANYEAGDYYLCIDMSHLNSFDSQLENALRKNPTSFVPLFEDAIKMVVQTLTVPRPKLDEMPDIQLQVKNFNIHTELRKLLAGDVDQMVCVSGIVISANRATTKATELSLMCRNCKYPRKVKCGAGFGGAVLPRTCETNQNSRMASTDLPKCPLDPFTILGDHCTYIDQQRLKLQENPEAVPTGEMPRHINLSCDRYLVDSVKPGTRITCIGIYTSYEARGSNREQDGISDSGIRIPYIRVLGIHQENRASDFLLGKFAPADVEEMIKISRTPKVYETISKSMCPAIFGSDDIKRAIGCMLFGGSRKFLPDGMRLRGDINVLLLGDPSCGKSQFLKFSSQVAPVAVYTSGKGSSAAGLTASILRDPGTGDFHLEGGALVLADGGLVCIDEFDKMREQDRVAIHEAMEQQTISIAKAGITTVLNSRTAVLAAANPTFGRYDDMKSPSENIDFQTTILSRFDLIFIVRDTMSVKRDMTIAKHVIGVHKNRDAGVDADVAIDSEQLKKYIAYARSKCDPRLTETAAQLLRDRYVRFRKQMRDRKAKDKGADAIPITVRQLEAIVRISESLARMELSDIATEVHVTEALRLFQVSTMSAATSDYGETVGSAEYQSAVKNAEKWLTNRVAIGSKVSHARLISEMTKKGFSEASSVSAIDLLVKRNKLKYGNRGKLVERMRA